MVQPSQSRRKTNKKGILSIKHPSFAPNEEVEVTILIKEGKKYDFSDLSGRLSWKGNGLKQQQDLRNEWE